MSENNGQFGGVVTYELLLDSGEYVRVQPFSLYAIRALRATAEEKFPFPDKTEYEKPMDAEKSLDGNMTIPAEENPDYRRLYEEAEEKQGRYVDDHCFALCVEPATSREAMVAKYKDRLAQMRKVMKLPKDDWDATLRFCIITSPRDYAQVVRAIQGKALPSEEEIVDAMRLFRCYVSKPPADGDTGNEGAQSSAPDQPLQAQSGTGTVQSGASVVLPNPQPDDSAGG